MNGTIDTDIIASAAADYPALAQLCGGYFHQDWREDHASSDDALQAFLEAYAGPLETEVTHARGQLGWPAPDANTVYVVFLPAGVTLTAGSDVSQPRAASACRRRISENRASSGTSSHVMSTPAAAATD